MKRRSHQGTWRVFIGLWVGSLLLLGSGKGLGSDYLTVEGPCDFSFPEDHGAHSGYQTEWWYYTGNLQAAGGRPFGFQLTFFRRQIVPPGDEKGWPAQPSSWRARNLFMAHAALSDMTENLFYWAEDMAREAVGLAGVRSGGDIEVFVGPWKTVMKESGHRLTAMTDAFSLNLMCRPLKRPVAHGRGGYSQKGVRPESASCYYSITRLDVSGSLSVQGKTFHVNGTAWMDHEYSSAPLEPSLTGWDWFSLQFADHTELMLYILRDRAGSWGPASSGTFVPSTGPAQHLYQEDFQVEVVGIWQSRRSGARYPCRWRVRIPRLDLDIDIRSRMGDQELTLTRSMKVSYWEGGVMIQGHKAGNAIDGVGYVELTGYAEPFDLLGRE